MINSVCHTESIEIWKIRQNFCPFHNSISHLYMWSKIFINTWLYHALFLLILQICDFSLPFTPVLLIFRVQCVYVFSSEKIFYDQMECLVRYSGIFILFCHNISQMLIFLILFSFCNKTFFSVKAAIDLILLTIVIFNPTIM